MTCENCNYSGYSPSAAVVLSPGELECYECEGTGQACAHGGWDCREGIEDCPQAECGGCQGRGSVVCECGGRPCDGCLTEARERTPQPNGETLCACCVSQTNPPQECELCEEVHA